MGRPQFDWGIGLSLRNDGAQETINDGDRLLAVLAMTDDKLYGLAVHQCVCIELRQFVVCELSARPVKIVVAKRCKATREVDVVDFTQLEFGSSRILRIKINTCDQVIVFNAVLVFAGLDGDLSKDASVFPRGGNFIDGYEF